MNDLPVFDEVHVVSDLHMGGRAGFQILRETTRLANFITRVGQQRPKGQVALVLNGDVFDTLAEDLPGYIAIDDAAQAVSRIMEDAAFATIWQAMAAFVKLPGRHLVFVIGNHDIEIALPPVQRLLLAALAGNDLAARARTVFSTAGAGFACMVGRSRIFCIHGNEVDGWNFNRYEDLARASRRLNAGTTLAASEWQPNAGTRMVKDVMNSVKHRYAWIDLLKPETSAAVGALLVLDPSQVAKINALLGVVGTRVGGDAQANARLSVEPAKPGEVGAQPAPTLEQVLGPNLRQGASQSADDMLAAAEANFGKAPGTGAPGDGTLGIGGLVWDKLTGWLRGVSEAEALRRALADWLAKDKTFEVDERDDTFKQVTAAVGSGIDFIVTGHTHLARAIEMGQGRYYFNCGTWIRLMRLTPAMLKDEASFKPVYDVLKDGRMQAIDDGKLVMDETCAVSITDESGQTVGRLVRVLGDGTGAPELVKQFQRA